VKLIVPTEGCPYVRFDGAIYKGAPHPNAARLLVDFFLGDEVQAIYANLGFVGVVGGLDAKVGAEARPFTRVKLLGTTDSTLQEEMLKTARQIYK
jgi:iron(III) transport system substrate-binding protein